MRQTQDFVFGRDDTKIIKGVAILLMLLHHLWAFPQRVFLNDGFTDTFSVFGEYWYFYLGRFGKICVSMFLFLSGYGLMKSKQSGRFDLIGKVKGLYLAYWKVFLVFIPIAFLFLPISLPTVKQRTSIPDTAPIPTEKHCLISLAYPHPIIRNGGFSEHTSLRSLPFL